MTKVYHLKKYGMS